MNRDIAYVVGRNLSLHDMIACRRVCGEWAEWFRTDRTVVRSRDGRIAYAREHDCEYLVGYQIVFGGKTHTIYEEIRHVYTLGTHTCIPAGGLRWVVDIGADMYIYTSDGSNSVRSRGAGLEIASLGITISTYCSDAVLVWCVETGNEDVVFTSRGGLGLPGTARIGINGSRFVVCGDAGVIYRLFRHTNLLCMFHVRDYLALGM